MEAWIAEGKKWQQVIRVRDTGPDEPEIGDFDDIIRHLVNNTQEDAGWVLKVGENWTNEPLTHTNLLFVVKDSIPEKSMKSSVQLS